MDPTLRATLSANFTKCVKGYHLINDDPIKESPWENINVQILNASGCPVEAQSNGSHKPGADLQCVLGGLSNKSTQYEASGFKLSSYRLTTVCSDKNPGTIEAIMAEINRRKDFAYYSIIVRNEQADKISYDWFMIPADYAPFNPATYKWSPKLGKTGKNKGVVTGWQTDVVNGSSMSITFSMSSQLWMDIHLTDDIKKYIIGSVTVSKGRKYNYIQLSEMFTN